MFFQLFFAMNLELWLVLSCQCCRLRHIIVSFAIECLLNGLFMKHPFNFSCFGCVHLSVSSVLSRVFLHSHKILMEHISEQHSRTCFWWHTDTLSHKRRHRAMFPEFSASSFTKHDWELERLMLGRDLRYSSIFKCTARCVLLIHARCCWSVLTHGSNHQGKKQLLFKKYQNDY